MFIRLHRVLVAAGRLVVVTHRLLSSGSVVMAMLNAMIEKEHLVIQIVRRFLVLCIPSVCNTMVCTAACISHSEFHGSHQSPVLTLALQTRLW